MAKRDDIIRIYNVGGNIHESIRILAKDKECTIGELVRPMTKKIIEIFDEMPFREDETKVINVPGMTTEHIRKFKEIKQKTGINGGIILNLSLYLFLKNQSSFSKSLFEDVFSTSSMSIPDDLT